MLRLSASDLTRMQCAYSLLARPQFGERAAGLLRQALTGETWQPIPLVRTVAALEPLFLHHLTGCGVDASSVFSVRAPGLRPARGFAEMALDYHQRFALLRQALTAMHGEGVGRVLLLKGAALAPRYPAPALRWMSDIDLAIAPGDQPAAARALAACGWRRRHVCYVHATGQQLDILLTRTPGARAVAERSQPLARAHPGWIEGLDVREPDDADHVRFLALHAVQHGGMRLYQDFCDAHLLLDEGRRAETGLEALRRSCREGGATELLALLTVYNERAEADRMLDLGGAESAWHGQRARAGKLGAAMAELALEPLSSTQLGALGSLLRPGSLTLAGIVRRLQPGRAGGGGTSATGGGDDLPLDQMPRGFWRRQGVKLRLMGELLRDGSLLHHLRMAWRLRAMNEAPRLFSPEG